MENPIEKGPERIPKAEEILEVIGRFAKESTLTLIKSDNDGPYLMDVVAEEKATGEVTEYKYQRKGSFRGDGKNNGSLVTEIDAYYYQNMTAYKNGEPPISAKLVARYHSQNGSWEEIE